MITTRVESEHYYITLEMFLENMKRMFANARTYNMPHTVYYKFANGKVLINSSYILQFLFCFSSLISLHIYIYIYMASHFDG